MRIATKGGDKGESGLLNGKRASKSAAVFKALGDLDELNSFLGWCGFAIKDRAMLEVLEKAQNDLYKIMSFIGNEGVWPEKIQEISEQDVVNLEAEIEKLEKELGVLTKFIKPGTSEASARLHIARSVCRRAERSVVEYLKDGEPGHSMKYLNRLSDLLFLTACRFEEKLEKHE